jgi:hypothetical protein
LHDEKLKHEKIKIQVSPNQESHRLLEAQELLHHLQGILMEGDAPAIEILSTTLQRAEELSSKVADHPSLDEETRKTLEDIAELLLSARKMGQNKGIADRLQKISEESAKALEATRSKDMSQSTKESTRKILNYIQAWRPVFVLLMKSRDFRQLIIDSIRIARRVVYSYGEDYEDTKQKFAEGAGARELATHVKERTKNIEVPEMSEEEWDLLYTDLQEVLVTMAREPTYREGMDRIFSLLEMFEKSMLETDLSRKSNILPNEEHIRNVVTETEELVACFSGDANHSGEEILARFKKHLRNLIVEIQNNESLSNYLYELRAFILTAKSEEEIRSDEFRLKAKNLVYRGRDLMRELRDHDDLNPFLESASDLLENIKNDEYLQILRRHAGIIKADLSYVDSEGVSHVDTNLLSKLKGVLIAVVADALKYIPIPKIENKDAHREFSLDNIVLCSYDIIPDKIRFHLETDSELSVRDVEINNTNTRLVISLDLRTEIKDVEFHFHKKTFPKFEENGRVTFKLLGDGARLTFTYAVEQGPNDEVPKMTQGYANFDISKMAIDFDNSTLKHPVMVPMLTSLFKTTIKQQIEKAIEKNLSGFVGKVGERMTGSLTNVNTPLLSGLDIARKAVKSSQLAEVHQKRKEKLE